MRVRTAVHSWSRTEAWCRACISSARISELSLIWKSKILKHEQLAFQMNSKAVDDSSVFSHFALFTIIIWGLGSFFMAVAMQYLESNTANLIYSYACGLMSWDYIVVRYPRTLPQGLHGVYTQHWFVEAQLQTFPKLVPDIGTWWFLLPALDSSWVEQYCWMHNCNLRVFLWWWHQLFALLGNGCAESCDSNRWKRTVSLP